MAKRKRTHTRALIWYAKATLGVITYAVIVVVSMLVVQWLITNWATIWFIMGL